jgi:putative FmdB family regulatory protein
MPIYEYVCPTCGQSFEKLVRGGRNARDASVSCPTCGQDSHRREVTLVAPPVADGFSRNAAGRRVLELLDASGQAG